MGYEKLSLNGFINEIKEVSSGPHPRKFCFVLGAGASRASGIKSGQELVNIWDKELSERNEKQHLQWKSLLGINDTNKANFYSQYYEKRFKRQPADGYNYLEKLMERAKPSIGYVMLSYLLTQTNHNVVITTNFDHLVEDAVSYYTQTIPLIIGHESLAHYVSKQINRPTIIKIHRDLLFDPKNRTDEVEVLHNNWEKVLGIIFSEYHPIFVGYAGNDNSLMDFLLKNSEKFSKNEWAFPYWMLYKSDKIGEKIEQFIEKSEGYIVRHNGFDEVMCLLGAAFDNKLPSKEDFINDAERRFQDLSDSIDEFTQKMEMRGKPGYVENVSGIETIEVERAVQKITNQTELQRLYRQAVMLSNIGKYDEAIEMKQQLILKDPENARYYDSLGSTLHNMERYEDALSAKQKAVELDPENASYHDSLSITLHEMGKYDRALEEDRKAIELDPQNASYRDGISVTLHKMERYEEALEEAQKAIALDPENASYHEGASLTLYKMERYEEALEEAQKAIALDPEKARYYDTLSFILHEMEHYEESLVEAKKAIKLDAKNASYHGSASITLHKMKRYEEALEEAQKAIELDPENASYYEDMGNILHDMKQYKEALEAKRKAVEIDSKNKKYKESLEATLNKMTGGHSALNADKK